MQKKQENEKLLNMVYAGLFAALTALFTATLHIPVGNGYIHCGDAVIYLAAALLPMPYAVGASAVGGMTADLLSGYPMYALPTFIIKGLLALTFSLIGGKRPVDGRRIAAMLVCSLISIVGYWLTAVLLYGGWQAQLIGTAPGNLVQALGSGLVYAAVAAALERIRNRRPHLMF
ncbi:MAG: TIGR04002 family protein [Oscillospiraceae bacterium]|nr:TIGR04002 family protein [Oscillospiraceae bacterium]